MFILDFIRSQYFAKLPIPTTSCTGFTAIITGSNIGLGLETARYFASLGADTVILAVRDEAKGQEAKADIERTTSCGPDVVRIWHLDLSSFSSVKSFAELANRELKRLDALVHNAAVATFGVEKLQDGYEAGLTVNALSPLLLAIHLLPLLSRTAEITNRAPHLTFVTSEMHLMTRFPAQKAPGGELYAYLSAKENLTPPHQYNDNKLLQVFYTRELARRLPPASTAGIIVNCVNPGLCVSNLRREFPGVFQWVANSRLISRSTELGSRTIVHAALEAGAESNGAYMSDCAVVEPNKVVLVEGLQGRVFEEALDVLEERVPGTKAVWEGVVGGKK